MRPLNLPHISPKLRRQDAKLYIFDIIRKKFVRLTPEEWVRQHFIHYLIDNQYPKSLFAIEKGIKYNQRQKRTDILVLGRDGKPFLLVECKAPTAPINQHTWHQMSIYHYNIKSENIALTNGMTTIYAQITHGKISFLNKLPVFPLG